MLIAMSFKLNIYTVEEAYNMYKPLYSMESLQDLYDAVKANKD